MFKSILFIFLYVTGLDAGKAAAFSPAGREFSSSAPGFGVTVVGHFQKNLRSWQSRLCWEGFKKCFQLEGDQEEQCWRGRVQRAVYLRDL